MTYCRAFIFALLINIPVSLLAETRQEVDLSGKGWKLWLDKDASWQNDDLFLPPVDLSKLPANAPTGGWDALANAPAKDVAVPGTVEEYLQTTPGPKGDITGVSWWYRSVQIPASSSPKRILLRFEAARQRAEVYVNQKLVGYDLVGNTPFEADLSDVAKPGQTVQLAIRITDPGGNFDWHDKGLITWGKNRILWSHGFAGITGRVKLIVCDPVYVDELYIQNTPAVTEITTEVTINNTTGAETHRELTVRVLDAGKAIATETVKNVALVAGSNVVKVKVSAPGAKHWDTENPNLYTAEVSIADADLVKQAFGFRWFEPVGIGSNAMFRLNGKRIVLRSAISWGFWPINGIYATAEMAEKQIQTAKKMGLNMLNFHRCVGQPVILEKADQMGLLYYEEPGNIASGLSTNAGALARGMAREKYLRMVKRDRSHPSMIIYCMTNETDAAGAVLQMYTDDMKLAHAIDPSRIFTRSSGLRCTPGIEIEMSTKMHMRPFDDKVYMSGWYDDHAAGGPAVWTQSAYKNPKDYYKRTENSPEIIFWGEEGAISTPPRLGLIKEQLDKSPNMGWDGQMYRDWYTMFDSFLTTKKLRGAFPTVDSLCAGMGDISMEHQGRKIQVIRINNDTDAYCINGWESEIIENHSGVVDCFRNPKGSPYIMAYYNQPLYLPVLPRNQVVQVPGKVVVDFFAINEKDLKGNYKLQVSAEEISGRRVFTKQIDVNLTGGDVYGQLLQEAVEVTLNASPGRFTIDAKLLDAKGETVASGHDEVLGVNWKSAELTGKGAVLDAGGVVGQFLSKQKSIVAPDYADGLEKLDWIIAARGPNASVPVVVPAGQLRELTASFFTDANLATKVHERKDETIDLTSPDGAPPDANVNALGNYAVRWEGQLVPPSSGAYTFNVQATGQAVLTVGEQTITVGGAARGGRGGRGGPPPVVQLEAGKSVPIKLEWRQGNGDAVCRLTWIVPNQVLPDAQKLIDRVKEGATLLVVDHAPEWMDLIKQNTSITYDGSFAVGRTWAGGTHFVKEHPLFKELPTNDGMNWPYQAVVRDGDVRYGLVIGGDELVAGAFHANMSEAAPPRPIALGTAVGVIPCGKGKIVVSTLEICGNLSAPEGPADVARKLLCNFIEFATTK